MSVPAKGSAVSTDNPEQYAKVLTQARLINDDLMKGFGAREQEIELLINEIIENYINSEDTLLSGVSDPIQIQNVLARSQNYLSRVAEIHGLCMSKSGKLKAKRGMIHDTLLPLLTGGSADSRMAKANDMTKGINYMIAIEDNLLQVCDSAMKNLRNAQDMASRMLKAVEMDLVHFNGVESLIKIANKSREKYYGKS